MKRGFPYKAVPAAGLKGNATEKQKLTLRRFGLKVRKGLTKAEASQMIGKHLEGLREAARARSRAFSAPLDVRILEAGEGFSCTHDMPPDDESYYDGYEEDEY